MKLYHYTCQFHLDEILHDGFLKLTRSNLMQPIAPYVADGVFRDATDNIKPVVWFSSELNFKNAVNNGLDNDFINDPLYDKTAIAIVIDTDNNGVYEKWEPWALKNGIDRQWLKVLKQTAPNWRTFYISEKPVKIDSNTEILYKKDFLDCGKQK